MDDRWLTFCLWVAYGAFAASVFVMVGVIVL